MGAIEEYLDELRFLGRAASTVRLRGYQLGAWGRWMAGAGLDLGEVERLHVVTYLMTFPDPETRASNMAAVRGLTSWAADTGRIGSDPCRRLPSVHRRGGDPRPCPDSVVQAALAVASPLDRDMIVLGRFAGLRAAEIAQAHRDYLRGPHGRETIKLCGKGGRWREFPAHPAVVQVLERAQGWVFPSPVRVGQPILAGTVTAHLRDLLPAPWTAHSLRHAFATELYERSGKDLRLVQEAMGHASPQTTALYVGVTHDFAAMRSLHLVAA